MTINIFYVLIDCWLRETVQRFLTAAGNSCFWKVHQVHILYIEECSVVSLILCLILINISTYLSLNNFFIHVINVLFYKSSSRLPLNTASIFNHFLLTSSYCMPDRYNIVDFSVWIAIPSKIRTRQNDINLQNDIPCFYYYHWIDAISGELWLFEGFIRPNISMSALT